MVKFTQGYCGLAGLPWKYDKFFLFGHLRFKPSDRLCNGLLCSRVNFYLFRAKRAHRGNFGANTGAGE